MPNQAAGRQPSKDSWFWFLGSRFRAYKLAFRVWIITAMTL